MCYLKRNGLTIDAYYARLWQMRYQGVQQNCDEFIKVFHLVSTVKNELNSHMETLATEIQSQTSERM